MKPSLLLRDEARVRSRQSQSSTVLVVAGRHLTVWQAGSLRTDRSWPPALPPRQSRCTWPRALLERSNPLRGHDRSPPPRGPAIEPARQPDAHRPAGRRPGQLLHHRVRSLQENLVDRFGAQRGLTRHVLDRRSARSGEGGEETIGTRWRHARRLCRSHAPASSGGRRGNLENYEDVRGRGSLAREYTITYRSKLARTGESSPESGSTFR